MHFTAEIENILFLDVEELSNIYLFAYQTRLSFQIKNHKRLACNLTWINEIDYTDLMKWIKFKMIFSINLVTFK